MDPAFPGGFPGIRTEGTPGNVTADRRHKRIHYSFPDPLPLKDPETGIRRCCGHDLPADFRPGTADCRMGTEKIRPAVCVHAVRIHDPAGKLYHFAYMAGEEHLVKVIHSRGVQRIADKIGAHDHRNGGIAKDLSHSPGIRSARDVLERSAQIILRTLSIRSTGDV